MKTCKKCKGTVFYKDGTCKNCKLAYGKIWRSENKERHNKLIAAWHSENKERVKKIRKERDKKNKDHIKIINSMWQKENVIHMRPFKRINEHNRRAKKRDDGGKLSVGLTEKLFKLQGGKCACCRKSLGKDYHLDHIMPIALGGAGPAIGERR